MKGIVFIATVLVFVFAVSSYALESAKLMDTRDKVIMESGDIKALLNTTKDIILVSSMWDSCALTISQLDAYFSQLGIFNTIKKQEVTEEAINFIVKWLEQIKNTNEINIKSLNEVTQKLEAKTKLHLERLKGYFKDLNQQIDGELSKLDSLKKSLGVKP